MQPLENRVNVWLARWMSIGGGGAEWPQGRCWRWTPVIGRGGVEEGGLTERWHSRFFL